MRKKILIVSAFIVQLVVLFFGLGSPQSAFAERDSPAKNQQIAQGIIKENTPASFIIIDETGKEIQLYTGSETKYVPSDFRSRKGDEVAVRYGLKKSRKGEMVAAVTQLQVIRPDPIRKDPKNPAVGTIVEAGEKFYKIQFPEIQDPMTYDTARSTKYIPQGWKPQEGDKVKTNYKRVPSRWGNYYVYAIIRFEKVE
ncbi:MAG: hypothetical protein KKE17_11865 [Proteobacteria bacterium]|nr:hypothetical protein [Pseudomonadota bacterium]MBU1710692.1 hypothetical protein [Pseudomonadota bacterium]